VKPERMEVYWLDAHRSLSLAELSELSGLPLAELGELVERGVFEPCTAEADGHRFAAGCVTAARTAARLRTDFDLQPSGLALAMKLLERVRELEVQMRDLQARLPRYR